MPNCPAGAIKLCQACDNLMEKFAHTSWTIRGSSDLVIYSSIPTFDCTSASLQLALELGALPGMSRGTMEFPRDEAG